MLLHVWVAVLVPLGPLAGGHSVVCALVLQREPAGWRAASLHNSLGNDSSIRPDGRPALTLVRL